MPPLTEWIGPSGPVGLMVKVPVGDVAQGGHDHGEGSEGSGG